MKFESNLHLRKKRQLFVENLCCLVHLKRLDHKVRVLYIGWVQRLILMDKQLLVDLI